MSGSALLSVRYRTYLKLIGRKASIGNNNIRKSDK